MHDFTNSSPNGQYYGRPLFSKMQFGGSFFGSGESINTQPPHKTRCSRPIFATDR